MREVNGPVRWGWLVGLNVVLGVVGYVPLFLVVYLVVNILGIDAWRNPTENDGGLPLFVLLVPIAGASALTWWGLNRWVSRAAGARAWWSAAAVTVLTWVAIIAAASFA